MSLGKVSRPISNSFALLLFVELDVGSQLFPPLSAICCHNSLPGRTLSAKPEIPKRETNSTIFEPDFKQALNTGQDDGF